jgi:hypothetical protein
MPLQHKPGEYKVVDEVTGKEFSSGDMVVDWDGSIRHRSNIDGEHPDYWEKRYPTEHYPGEVSEPPIDVYVTAAVAGGQPVEFYAGTDVPRLRE